MSPAPIEFARRDLWSILGLIVSSLFVAIGLILLFGPDMPARTRWTGAGNIVFFGACALFYLSQSRRASVALRLDAAGMEYRHPDPRQAFWVIWPAVAGARVSNEDRSSCVALLFRSSEDLASQPAPDWADEPGAWPPRIPPEMTLSASSLGTTATELADTIERFRLYYGRGGPTTLSGTSIRPPFV